MKRLLALVAAGISANALLAFGALAQATPGVTLTRLAAAAQSLVRPASAARALQNGVPNIERADKLVQLIAKQKGLSLPAIDAQVALVDRRIEANRKKAAA
jgi:hypothetical protein